MKFTPEKYEIFDHLSTGVQVINSALEYVFLNTHLLNEVGKRKEELIGKAMHQVFPGIETTEIYQKIKEVLRSGESLTIVNYFTFSRGVESYYQLQIDPLEDGVILLSQDITNSRSKQMYTKELVDSLRTETSHLEELLRKVLDSSLDGVQYFRSVRNSSGIIKDFEFVFSNRVACEIIGRKEDEIAGKLLLEELPGNGNVVPEYGKSLFELYCEVVETGESKSLLFKFESDGIDEWFMNKSVKLADGFVVTFSVVTEVVSQNEELQRLNRELQGEVQKELAKRKENEQLLIQQSRLAAMGDMFSAIAHQWRQPLGAIGPGIEIIDDICQSHGGSLPPEDLIEVNEILGAMREQLGYLSRTIDDFKDFVTTTNTSTSFSFDDVVESSVRFFDGHAKSEGVVVTVDSNFKNVHLVGNPNQLRQVLMNLIHNAIFAFRSSKRGPGEKRIEIRQVQDDPSFFEFSIRDNAGTFEKYMEEKIFTPYFTTKGSSGTGIGLYIAKMIVEKSFRGKIEFEFNKDYTDFRVRLMKEMES